MPIAAAPDSNPPATWRTASAVERAATTGTPGSDSRRKRPHWPLACGCDTTARTSASSSGPAATRCRWTGWRSSPTITTSSVSNAIASSVGVTDPSSEFSIGTSARSTSPSWTAITASCRVGSGTSANASEPAADSTASWLTVPSGPR